MYTGVGFVGGNKSVPGVFVMTPQQARAARAVLRLSVRALAAQSDVSESSIRRIEAAVRNGTDNVTLDLLVRLQNYYESRGLNFRFDGMHCVCWPEDTP